MKQKTREEVSCEYKWDLTKIFNSDKEWNNSFKEISKEIKIIKKYKGKLNTSLGILEYIKTSINLERKLYKLYYYAHLLHDQDTTNATYQDMLGKINDLISLYSNYDSYSSPEFMKLDMNKIDEFINEEPSLEQYRFYFENKFRFKKHILNSYKEKMLSILSKNLDSSSKIFSSLNDSDMKFGNIMVGLDEVELTNSNYRIYIESKDRSIREQAFKLLLNTYSNYKNTMANVFASNVDSSVSVAKLRKHKSSIEASLFSDNVDIKIYNNLIDTVTDNLNVLHKYYDLKKEILNLDELHLYDVYVDMTPNYEKEYSFKEAKELVMKSLKVLGDDYILNASKAFDEKWIDVYNNKGKRTGAYSSGFYDTNPYILLNFEGRLGDVSTLTHELGHSMHTYYSCLNNPYQYSNYKIFVAEVASTVNELLLNFHMLNNSKDNTEKLFIIDQMLELFRATIYRQTMFAEFEKNMHAKYEKGEVLTYELLCNDYYKLNKKYFGPSVVVDELIKYEWERIPHFYYDFYVYKYSIGLSCACYIVEKILNDKDNMKEKYLEFLSSGGSDYPVDILKKAGVDVTDKEVIKSAIKMFDDLINKYKEVR